MPGRYISVAVLVLSLSGVTPARAVTLGEVVALTEAGLGPQVLVALIETGGRVYDVGTQDLVRLKQSGVDDRVLVALIRRSLRSVASASSAPEPVEAFELAGSLIIGRRASRVTAPPWSGGFTVRRPSVLTGAFPAPGAGRRGVRPFVSSMAPDPALSVFNSFGAAFGREVIVGAPAAASPTYWGWGGTLRPGAWGR